MQQRQRVNPYLAAAQRRRKEKAAVEEAEPAPPDDSDEYGKETVPHWPPCRVIDRDLARLMSKMEERAALRAARKMERQWLREESREARVARYMDVPRKTEREAWDDAWTTLFPAKKRTQAMVMEGTDEVRLYKPSFMARLMGGLLRMIFSILISVLMGYAMVTLFIGKEAV